MNNIFHVKYIPAKAGIYFFYATIWNRLILMTIESGICMKSKFSLLIILLPFIVLAQTDAEDCYRDVMADAIIKTGSNSYVSFG